MAEAMTVETIVEAYWQLRGYWTRLRVPFPTQLGKGYASDIDLLAYEPEEQSLVISQCKVQGEKTKVFAYTEFSKQARRGSFLKRNVDNFLSFLKNLGMLCRNGTIFKDFRNSTDSHTIQLVSNYYIQPSLEDECKEER